MSVYIRAYNMMLPDFFEERFISYEKKIRGTFGRLDIPRTHPLYPERSDAKIMRMDVVASIIVIRELLQKLDMPPEILADVSLLVANGAFLEEDNKHMKRIMKTLQKVSELGSKTEKLTYVYKSVPPLTALETLTNSTMSFIAKYTGIKGNNTTFGNTSYGGFSALRKGMEDISAKGLTNALIGGANGSGAYSALAHLNFQDKVAGWKESAASAFILLQKEKSSIQITKIKHEKRVPSLLGSSQMRNWEESFIGESSPEFIIYSGGFTPSEFVANKKEVAKICPSFFSWNDQYGNLGAAAIPMNIIKGIQFIESGEKEVVDILDRDPYGRSTYLQLAKA